MLESTNAECSNTAKRPNCTKSLGKGELKKREKQKERKLEGDGEDKGKKCWEENKTPFSQTTNTYQHRLVVGDVSDIEKRAGTY